MSGLSAAADSSAADWVLAGVRDFDYTVGSIVPAVFEAYARVFHPAELGQGDMAVEVRWAEAATANGRVMHPAAEWGSLTGSWHLQSQSGIWDQQPRLGEVPHGVARALASILGSHTRTPQRCWFAPSAMREDVGISLLFSTDTSPSGRVCVGDGAERGRAAGA